MEREVGARHRRRVTGRNRGVDLVGEAPELPDGDGIAVTRKGSGGATLERGSQPVDVTNVVGGQAHDERATARLFVQQAFGAQELERLAHRAAADRELLGDLRLDQVLSLAEPAGQDLLADAVGGVLGQRSRRGQRRQGCAFTHLRSIDPMSTVDRRPGACCYSSPRARRIAWVTSATSRVMAKNPISASYTAGSACAFTSSSNTCSTGSPN